MTFQSKLGDVPWHSLSLRSTGTGLVAGERFERFKLEAVTELLLRVVGILMVCASVFMWLLLPVGADSSLLAVYSISASFLAAGGLGVFTYGTRGFRREMTLELHTETLKLAKLNMHGQSRVARTIDLNTIESVFVKRPVLPGGLATLIVRVTGKPDPVIALSGEIHDVETVHQQLCAVMHIPEKSTKPKAEVLPLPTKEPAKPRRVAA